MNYLIGKQNIGTPWDAPRRWIPFLRVEYHKVSVENISREHGSRAIPQPKETWPEKQARALRQTQH